MKLVGCLTLYCETNAAVPDLMEAVAALSEFLRCWSEIFDLILHFLYFNLENSCSQVPKSMNKAWLQNKGYFGLKNLVDTVRWFFELNIWLQLNAFHLKTHM